MSQKVKGMTKKIRGFQNFCQLISHFFSIDVEHLFDNFFSMFSRNILTDIDSQSQLSI